MESFYSNSLLLFMIDAFVIVYGNTSLNCYSSFNPFSV